MEIKTRVPCLLRIYNLSHDGLVILNYGGRVVVVDIKYMIDPQEINIGRDIARNYEWNVWLV